MSVSIACEIRLTYTKVKDGQKRETKGKGEII